MGVLVCLGFLGHIKASHEFSTTEALAEVIKEAPFLRQLRRFILPNVGIPCIPVVEDDHGAVQLA